MNAMNNPIIMALVAILIAAIATRMIHSPAKTYESDFDPVHRTICHYYYPGESTGIRDEDGTCTTYAVTRGLFARMTVTRIFPDDESYMRVVASYRDGLDIDNASLQELDQ